MDCVIYARVSSDRQEKEGFSIPAQLELLRTYAASHGHLVAREFVEAETAKVSGRAQFTWMLEFLRKQKKPVALLVEKTDRLYRNLPDYIEVDDLINRHGLAVHFVKENEIDSSEASSHAKFIRGIKVLMAKNYIDNLKEEVHKGTLQKLKEGGCPHHAPYGYKNDRLAKTVVIEPGQSPFVVRAFQLYATGLYSLDATIQKLHEEGFIYRPYQPKINRSYLQDMLTKPFYIGLVTYRGEVYEGKHPPLVDLSTWEAVQRALRKDNKPISMGRKEFLLRGMMTCGECGRVVLGEIKKGKYVYYRCGAFKKGCSQGYVPESKLLVQIEAVIHGLRFPEDFRGWIREITREMDDACYRTSAAEEARIDRALEKNRQRQRQVYSDRMDQLIDEDLYREFSENLQTERLQLQEVKAKIESAEHRYQDTAMSWVELPKRLSTSWSYAAEDEKKQILNLLLSNFFLKDGKATIELKEPFQHILEIAENKKWRGCQDEIRTFLQAHGSTIREVARALAA